MGFLKKLFGKKKEENIEFPYHYIRVVWTDIALHDSTFDDYNKEIQRIKNGKVVENILYTESDLEAMKEVYKIPFFDMTKIKDGEELNFESMDSLTGTFTEVRY